MYSYFFSSTQAISTSLNRWVNSQMLQCKLILEICRIKHFAVHGPQRRASCHRQWEWSPNHSGEMALPWCRMCWGLGGGEAVLRIIARDGYHVQVDAIAKGGNDGPHHAGRICQDPLCCSKKELTISQGTFVSRAGRQTKQHGVSKSCYISWMITHNEDVP